MRSRCSILALCALACGTLSGSSASAQGRRGGMSRPPSSHRPGGVSNGGGPNGAERVAKTPIEEFETLAPEQQQKGAGGAQDRILVGSDEIVDPDISRAACRRRNGRRGGRDDPVFVAALLRRQT